MQIEDDNVVNDDLYCLVIESFRAFRLVMSVLGDLAF